MSTIHPLIKARWSPRAFSTQTVEREKIVRMLEAARWSASCFNEQPWRFIVGVKGDGETHDKVLSTLYPGNQSWAGVPPVLILLVAKVDFSRLKDGKPNLNKYHPYDLGQAAAYISVQAMADDLYVHQMAGFDPNKARETFAIPEGYEPMAVMAIGYLGNVADLSEALQAKEQQPRTRRPMSELVFSDEWGSVSPLVPSED